MRIIIPILQILDFPKFFDPKNTMMQSISDTGTACYMAPEVIDSNQFNIKADVYAFGILMYEVITGKRAYSDLFKSKKILSIHVLQNKVKEGLRPKIEEGSMKKSLQAMIEACWSKDPSSRPSFSEIYRKLSLTSDTFFDYAYNTEPSVIKCDEGEEDENEKDDENEEKDAGIDTKYCLSSVNYEEVLRYVDEVSIGPISPDKKENSSPISSEVIESLKKEMDQLKKATENQETTISELKSKLQDQEETNKKIEDLKKKTASQKTTISTLQSKLANQEDVNKKIEDLKKKTATQEATISTLQSKLTNQEDVNKKIEELKKKTATQETTISTLQSKLTKQEELRRKIDEMKAEIENLKKQMTSSQPQTVSKNDTLHKNEPKVIQPEQVPQKLIEETVSTPATTAAKITATNPAAKATITNTTAKITATNATTNPAAKATITNTTANITATNATTNPAAKTTATNTAPVTLRFISFSNPKGIVSQLTETIKMSTGGKVDKDFPVENLKKYDNDFFYNYKDYSYCPQMNCYIEFDFGPGKKVDLYSYMIRTNKSSSTGCHPRSWHIVGSNDKVKWDRLDVREDDDKLKGEYKQFNFDCQLNKHNADNRYRYIRYFQDNSWQDEYPYRIFLTFFELYGAIYTV